MVRVSLFLSLLPLIFYANLNVANPDIDPIPSEDYCQQVLPTKSTAPAIDDVTWNQQEDVPIPFRRAGSGVIGNYWYCFGDQYSIPAQAFNLQTGQWEQSTPPPLGNCNWAGESTGEHLYLICRYESGGVGYGNEIQRFTPTAGGPTGTWELMIPYPLTLCGVTAAWDGGDYIYTAGGNPSPSTAAYKYSISGNSWTPIANLPIGMAYAGGAFCGGEFHVIGGYATSTTHFAYNSLADTWTAKAPPLEHIHFGTFGVSNDPEMTHIYSVSGAAVYGIDPVITKVQVYEAATDTWVEETDYPIEVAYCSADYIGNSRVISSGGYNGLYNVQNTYIGTGFPCPSSVYNIDIELTYISGPGWTGYTYFDLYIENLDTSPANFDAWLDSEYEGGAPTTLISRAFANYLPGWTINRPNTFFPVPGSWPAGNYMMWGRVGTHPDDIWDESGFPWVKNGESDGYVSQDWTPSQMLNPFDEIIEVRVLEISDSGIIGSYPNPFNPSTSIKFTLSKTDRVTLAVFDVTGRQVAELVNGYRTAGAHEVTFDAAGLSSGVYICELTSETYKTVSKMLLMK